MITFLISEGNHNKRV